MEKQTNIKICIIVIIIVVFIGLLSETEPFSNYSNNDVSHSWIPMRQENVEGDCWTRGRHQEIHNQQNIDLDDCQNLCLNYNDESDYNSNIHNGHPHPTCHGISYKERNNNDPSACILKYLGPHRTPDTCGYGRFNRSPAWKFYNKP